MNIEEVMRKIVLAAKVMYQEFSDNSKIMATPCATIVVPVMNGNGWGITQHRIVLEPIDDWLALGYDKELDILAVRMAETA